MGERTGSRPDSWLASEKERDLAFDHVEGLHVIPVQMKRNTHTTVRSLVHQRESPARAIPVSKEIGRRFSHPAKLAFPKLLHIGARRVLHGRIPH
jgi:hypothetical protein